MRELLADVGELGKQLVTNWVSLVGGGVAVFFAVLHWLNLREDAPFGTLAIVSFVVAMFVVWRNMKREARPYDAATLQFARMQWGELNGDQQAALRRLLVEKQVRANMVANLETCQFVSRNHQGMYSILPDFVHVVARIAKESPNLPVSEPLYQHQTGPS